MVACLSFCVLSGLAIDPFLRVEADTVLAEAETTVGDDDVDASALIGEITGGVEIRDARTAITFEIQVERVEFEDPDFTDRWRYFGRIEVERELDEQWTLRLRAERSVRFPSVEYFDIDEAEYRARLRYQPVRRHHFGIAFRWRDRDYRDGSGASGRGPRIEGEYRFRLGRYHYVSLDARHEDITSRDAFREYRRRAAAVSYTYPLADDLRIRPKFAYRVTEFPGRPVGSVGFRTDHQYTPEVELLWWPGKWRTSAELQYRHRDSSDADRSLSGLRFQLKVAHVF